VSVPRGMRVAALLLVLLIAAVLAFIAVGSQRRVPAPFGPALNGRVAIVQSGDIATVDPATNEIRTVVAGPEVDRFPVFSRDGTKIAFVRFSNGGDQLVAVDADGSHPVTLTPSRVSHIVGFTWSPDGSMIAFESAGGLWIVRTDGSDMHRIEIGVRLDGELAWRPPDGKELVFRGVEAGQAGLYAIKPDGTGRRSLTASDGAQFDYLWVTMSPDGGRLAYHVERVHEVHVLALDSHVDTVYRPTTEIGMMFPRFSPDGSRLAVMTWPKGGGNQVGVFAADDPSPDVAIAGPLVYNGIQFDWSPDGTQILAAEWATKAPYLLDPAGGPGQRTTWLAEFPDWIEWQRLAEAPPG
jgi:Tol biopolymer transport system component